jgi:CRP-like cAMP-binding protein
MQIDSSVFITDPPLVQLFQNQAVPLPCDRDRVLFFEGEDPVGLYILSKGSADLSWSGPDGQYEVAFQATAPSLIGLPCLLDGEPHPFTLMAHSGAKISFVSLYKFALMLEFDQMLARRALEALAAEARFTQRAILERFREAAGNAA